VPNERFAIEINGQEVTDVYEQIGSLEIELSHDLPATFALSFGIHKDPTDGSWTLLDDDRFRVWNEVAIRVGFVGAGQEQVIAGYVTRVTPRFAEDEGQTVLEIAGIDGSVVMDREEKLKDWPNKKDSAIAAEILNDNGFTPSVADTTIVHDKALSTIIQRETDWQFLRRLALRNGFLCYVDGTTGFFQPVPGGGSAEPVLAAHFGDETNLRGFSATVDALRPAHVTMYQVDRFAKQVMTAAVVASTRQPLGKLGAAALLPTGVDPARVYVARNAATGVPEMQSLCQGLFDEGAWFVDARGEIDAAAYGHVLRPRTFVPIKGIGETYSGVYYVTHVRHSLTRETYEQHFQARRDALLPKGDESFAAAGALAGLL